ncbi:MAG: DNA replication/repair protein RecF [Coriobacteriia bacterium]|nr:DNA replication/repair protein RecF [Coriobacteriia bacterium]
MNGGRDLRLSRVELTDFRSYGRFELQPGEALTIIVGPNASGKTNLLEAVYLTTAGSSFRRARPEDLIRRGARRATVRSEASSPEGSRLEVEMTAEDGSRRYRVNGKPVRRRSELAGRLPAVAFTPDDLALVKGPAEVRRDAIDEVGEGLAAAYGALRREYGRALRQRNALLKDGVAGAGELEPWTEQLSRTGSRLALHRTALLRRISAEAERVYGEVSGGERLHVSYEDAYGIGARRWEADPAAEEVEEAMRERFEIRRGDEIRRRTTLVGPHRDDVVLEVAGRDARAQASQGQQRTVALSWKIAELRVVRQVTGRRPVLLLDDVMSELDERRRGALTRHVGEGLQTLVTATTLDSFPPRLMDGARIVTMSPAGEDR